MKKSPIQWILALVAVICVIAAGVSAVWAVRLQNSVQEEMDHSQLSMINESSEIDEILLEQEQEEKQERQEALNEKLSEQAAEEAEEEAREQAEEQEQEAEPTVEETPEATPEPTEEPEEEEESEPEENSFVINTGKMIGIDPGHQGEWVDMSAMEANGPGSSETKARCTTGTTGNYTGLPEYQLNLDVSDKLRDILLERGYQVVMTRETNDANISNAERAQAVCDAGADIYVRIHANSADDSSASGALTMCPSSSNPYVSYLYEDSYRLAQTVLDAYCAATGIGNRGVTLTDTMTGINWSTIPVIIIEMGFMSNEHDDTLMADSDFQEVMAEGIANGIDAYFAESGETEEIEETAEIEETEE